MARNDDEINPTMVVDAIKDGLVKNQIIHDYRISDEELAMILLPQFRKGRLTKQEFNDFFKGLPVNRELQTPLELLTGEARLEDLQPPKDVDPIDRPVKQEKPPSISEAVAVETTPSSESTPKSTPAPGGGKAAAQTRAILDKIFSKLDAIENRLERIEDKIETD